MRHRAFWTLAGLIFILCLTTQAVAQVNIEQLRQDGEATGFSGSFAIGLEAQTGNTDIQELGVEGRLDYIRPSVTTFILTNSDFGWEQGQRFSNEALVHLRQGYRLRNRLRIEAFAQYNFDKTIFLDFRALGGAGLRFKLFDNKIVRLWEGSAYMLEHERLTLPPNAIHPDRTTVSRWSNYLSTRFTFNDRVSSAWTVYIQPRFSAMRDFRVLSDIDLGVDLGGPLTLTLSVQMRYDSRPPRGIKKVDTKIENSLVVVF